MNEASAFEETSLGFDSEFGHTKHQKIWYLKLFCGHCAQSGRRKLQTKKQETKIQLENLGLPSGCLENANLFLANFLYKIKKKSVSLCRALSPVTTATGISDLDVCIYILITYVQLKSFLL